MVDAVASLFDYPEQAPDALFARFGVDLIEEAVTRMASAESEPAHHALTALLAERISSVMEMYEGHARSMRQLLELAEEGTDLGDLVWHQSLAGAVYAIASLARLLATQPRRGYPPKVFPSEMQARARALIEELQDLSETVALGLNEQVQAELRERLATGPN